MGGPYRQETREEVYIAFKLLMEGKPEGTTATEVFTRMFSGVYSISTIRDCARELKNAGYLKAKRHGKAIFYILTEQEYPLTQAASPRPLPPLPAPASYSQVKPSQPLGENPGDPDYWLVELNKVLQSLQDLQRNLPTVISGILDMTRNLERLSKVKEILNNATNAVRGNI